MRRGTIDGASSRTKTQAIKKERVGIRLALRIHEDAGVAHQIHGLVLDLFQADRLVPGHLSSHHDVRAPTTRRNATLNNHPTKRNPTTSKKPPLPKAVAHSRSALSLSLPPSLNFTEEMRSGKRRREREGKLPLMEKRSRLRRCLL
ncbi:hypothetical protein GW17_00048447 [Ensete ventricosum]|nr:hypothetical protein GW17_00048447 [Ensete ventricosum]